MPPGFEPVRTVDGLQALFDLAGQPGDAPDDADRGRVEVGPLPTPLVEDVVNTVARRQGHRRRVARLFFLKSSVLGRYVVVLHHADAQWGEWQSGQGHGVEVAGGLAAPPRAAPLGARAVGRLVLIPG